VSCSREKEVIHLRDAVNAQRQALPWVKVDAECVFDSPEGKKALAELFAGRSPLMVYHFMLGFEWRAGCPGCLFLSDHVGRMLTHLNHHDVTWVAVPRAPMGKIAAYKKRMGGQFRWVSSFGTTFNHDYRVSLSLDELASGSIDCNYTATPCEEAYDELPGMSVFYRDEAGNVFHMYSTCARGLEDMVGTLPLLDRAPLGCNETGPVSWVRRRDEYEGAPKTRACCAS
jgi:predicted dithiol-disulfide oxidoreductase (DUF899 family)